MLSLYHQVTEYVEAGECPAVIFCDLSRAFDCVNHKVLLSILEMYGIRGVALNWISTFLQDREQYVSLRVETEKSVDYVNSECLNVNMGVPQGSILGPILFILYVNSISTVVENNCYTAYADDFSLVVSSKNSDSLNDKSTEVVTRISDFFNSIDLFFNTEKTDVLRIHNRQKEIDDLNFSVNSVVLTNTHDSVRFLGLHLDEFFNWKPHCLKLICKMNSLKFLFINLRTVLEMHQLVQVYFAQVDSRLRYGICLWGNSTEAANVFMAQKRIIRSMTKIPQRESCKNYFKELNILPLPCLYVYEMSVYVYMNKISFIANKNIHSYNTRHVDQFHVPFARQKLTLDAPNCLGPKIYNSLPESIKDSDNLYIFKRNLKKYLIEKCFYKISDFFK